jgi:hypothetical protein
LGRLAESGVPEVGGVDEAADEVELALSTTVSSPDLD